MKQQYRHTKPIRGKDPNFEKSELKEARDANKTQQKPNNRKEQNE